MYVPAANLPTFNVAVPSSIGTSVDSSLNIIVTFPSALIVTVMISSSNTVTFSPLIFIVASNPKAYNTLSATA